MRSRAIETAQVVEELIAFHNALANNASAAGELGEATLRKTAVEITDKLRASTVVRWQMRDSVRAKLRILVSRTLQRSDISNSEVRAD